MKKRLLAVDEGGSTVLTANRCRVVRCAGRQGFPLGDSWRILAMTRVLLSTISPLSRALLTMKVGLCCVCDKVPVVLVPARCRVLQKNRSRLARGTVDTRKTGSMVWRITLMFQLSVHASLTIFVHPVSHQCLRSWRSYPVSHQRVACGRGATGRNFV